MAPADRSALNERSGRLAAYYSLARPLADSRKVVGSVVRNEAMADMAGLKAVLYLVREKDDFDYDSFFRSYAALWRVCRSSDFEKTMLAADVHPLAFYRINIGLQQFDEFRMYLAPERRVSVW